MRNIYGLLSVFNAPINQHTIECTTIIQQRYQTLYNHFLRNTDMSSISDTSFGLQRYPNPCNSFLCNTDTLQYGHFYLLQFSWFCCPSSDLAKVSLESKDVFERRTSTGKDVLSAFFGSGFAQIFGKIVPIKVKTLPGALTTQI